MYFSVCCEERTVRPQEYVAWMTTLDEWGAVICHEDGDFYIGTSVVQIGKAICPTSLERKEAVEEERINLHFVLING